VARRGVGGSESGGDQLAHLGAGVVEIPRLDARRLAGHHEAAVGVEAVGGETEEAAPGSLAQPLDQAQVDAKVDFVETLFTFWRPGPRRGWHGR
jgi:hypothetical protein